jgi:hypothetical protein
MGAYLMIGLCNANSVKSGHARKIKATLDAINVMNSRSLLPSESTRV